MNSDKPFESRSLQSSPEVKEVKAEKEAKASQPKRRHNQGHNAQDYRSVNCLMIYNNRIHSFAVSSGKNSSIFEKARSKQSTSGSYRCGVHSRDNGIPDSRSIGTRRKCIKRSQSQANHATTFTISDSRR